LNLELLSSVPESSSETPVLFVHGVLHGAWFWENFLPYFSSCGFPAYALSLRGHGASPLDVPLNHVRTSDYVNDIRTAVNTIEGRTGLTPIVIGHSMGGYLVQRYLQKYAAPKAVLVASAPPHGVIMTALRMQLFSPLTTLKMLLGRKLSPMIETDQATRDFAFSESMPLDEVAKHRERMCEESFRAFLDMLYRLPNPRRVSTPLYVVGAEKDTVFAPWEIRKTARQYDAPCEIFPNMAHDMMLENGWESVADSIIDWLRSF